MNFDPSMLTDFVLEKIAHAQINSQDESSTHSLKMKIQKMKQEMVASNRKHSSVMKTLRQQSKVIRELKLKCGNSSLACR